jgi:hypothetical protein
MFNFEFWILDFEWKSERPGGFANILSLFLT